MDDITVGELARWLDRIETKLDAVIGDYEHRIRRTERVMYVAIGLAVAGTGSGIVSLLTMLIGGG